MNYFCCCMEGTRRPLERFSLAALFCFVLTVGAFICTRYVDFSTVLIAGNSTIFTTKTVNSSNPPPTNFTHKIINIPLNCSLGDSSRSCPVNYYPSSNKQLPENNDLSSTPPPTCPDYFRNIYDDLWLWRETGITQEMVMSVSPKTASFRLVILDGRVYMEKYQKSFQSRDTFTLWGILQLLRKYPGKVPDLDLMFDTADKPVLKKDYFKNSAVPPLFRYCGDGSTYSIVFPDWSFWGWHEINIKPWEALSKELAEGNKRIRWTEREPYAYWKGNPRVAPTRMNLLTCNVSDKQEWNARVYAQDWLREQREGYKQSDLASQCVHRYKIYIEGAGWSVSEKYILACDSLTLLVKPHYYDFFTRGLMPLKHYWPIKDDDKCRSIKYAVEWGNNHQTEAQVIGNAASKFVQEELKMDYVYDYMFHLLSEYANLLNYKPTVPEKAVEICSEAMACTAHGLEKDYMIDSLVKSPSFSSPCTMPPPYDPASIHSVIQKREDSLRQVETMEKQYWESQTQPQTNV